MPEPDPFDAAVALHAAGRLAEAEAACRGILASEPRHSGALLLLGVVRAQRGEPTEGLVLISRSLGIAPDVPTGHFWHGLVLAGQGRSDEAMLSYRRATELEPDFAEAHYNLGHLLLAANRPEEALAAFERALAPGPEFTEAHCARAAVLVRLDRRAEALAELDGVLARQPGFAPALNMRSELLCELGRFEESLADCRRSLAIDVNQALAHASLGSTLVGLGRLSEALEALNRALALDPNCTRALAMRAVALRECGRLAESLADCDRAVALAPNDAVAHLNRGDTLLSMGQSETALKAFNRAAALNPRPAKTYASRAIALRHLQRLDEALADCDRALDIDPSQGVVASERFLLAGLLCDWRERAARTDDLRRRIREGQVTSPWVAATALDDPELQLMAARRVAKPGVAVAPRTPAHERLRVAYLSPDFHEHPTAHLLVELIERHDKTRFETFGVSLGAGRDSDIRRRIGEAFEHFVEAGGRSDAEVAALLRESEIDIAVDLAGHAGGGRPGIFALRPAPIAVNYAGHPGTTGSDQIDYILADAVVIPPGGEAHFSEQVVRLPDCYLPSDTRFEVAPAPGRAEAGLPEQGFVFCSFNNGYKLMPEMFDIWMRLLRAADGSVLWLLAENATMRRRLEAEAEARGVAPERLVFAGRLPRAQYLARLALADCFLDSLPCNAHTTASDALWMGVPLITCMGGSFAARVAGSMLTCLGMPELIARDLADYETIALDLAKSPERLHATRETLIRNRASRPLFDMARLARHIESAYETMWKRRGEGLAPAAFDVEPEA